MFKKDLAARMNRIFGIPKVSFDSSADREQNVLFIDVTDTPRVTAKKTLVNARVVGTISMYAPNDKLTFGFFQKKLHTCNPEDAAPLFFSNFDQTGEYYDNLVERKCDFEFFFRDQYDPSAGLLNEVDFTFTFEE